MIENTNYNISFKNGYHKIKCVDISQAKKLMNEMTASLKNADFTKGSKENEIMIGKLSSAYETEKMMRCLQNASDTYRCGNIDEAINAYNIYKQPPKNQPAPKVDVIL